MKTCSGCGAEIVWARTMSGAYIPLDAKPEKRVVLTDQGMHTMFMFEDDPAHENTRAQIIDTWMPHHATCSKVEQFREQFRGARPERPTQRPAPAAVSIGGAEGWPAT